MSVFQDWLHFKGWHKLFYSGQPSKDIAYFKKTSSGRILTCKSLEEAVRVQMLEDLGRINVIASDKISDTV